MGAVGRADLAQGSAGAPEDVGDAKLAADLDQLPAGDHDLLAPGQGLEREQHRGGAVVDDQRGLGPGEPPERALHVRVAGAPLLARDVHLEVRVRGGDLAEALLGERRQQRAAQVGVQHHPGGVDHRREREETVTRERVPHAAAQGRHVGGGPARLQQASALGGQRLADGGGHPGTRDAGQRRVARERPDHRVDRGQCPQQGLHRRGRRPPTRRRQARSPRAPSPARSPRGPRAGSPPDSRPPRERAGDGAPRPP